MLIAHLGPERGRWAFLSHHVRSAALDVGGSESKCKMDCHEGRENTQQATKWEDFAQNMEIYTITVLQESIWWSLSGWMELSLLFIFWRDIYGWTALAVHEPPKSTVYLQSRISFSIAIDIQPTSAGERRDEQMKSEHWLQHER
jgi:hypothetical protein